MPLGARWLCRCDIPDLTLFPRRYSGVNTVSFEAGFASDVGHLVVWTLARLVKARVLPSAIPFAAPLNRLSRWIEPLVSHKGGMFVRLKGLVVRLQIRMRDLARAYETHGMPLGEKYLCYSRIWFWLGVPAFSAVIVIFWLMVAKP
jgi:hypothetical protein